MAYIKGYFFTVATIILTPLTLRGVDHWDWAKINPQEKSLHFPSNFVWGVATSAQQVEGCHLNNSWTQWELDGNVKEPCGTTCDHWNRYKEDIKLIKALGANTYRFSIEWSKIEQKPGIFDEKALDHYEAVCDELVANGIKPAVTLHHYTDPIWFMDKGGFEAIKNSTYFVDFCAHVFARLHKKVAFWFTFNSPCGYAANGYYRGATPPGKKSMQLSAEVFKNVLETHVQVYQRLKAMPGGEQSRIGILKNIYQLEPYCSWNPLDCKACSFGSQLQNTCFYDFFTTGTYKVYIPWMVNVTYTNKRAPKSLDFIGLNYYGHTYMKNFSICTPKDEEKTQNANYTLYPEGMYQAIAEISEKIAEPLHIPIYITENGIATNDEAKRDRFYRRYLYAISKAIEDGYDVRGYITWTLMDNYEWGTYKKKYGLYKVDFATQERQLKSGATFLMSVMTAQPTAESQLAASTKSLVTT